MLPDSPSVLPNHSCYWMIHLIHTGNMGHSLYHFQFYYLHFLFLTYSHFQHCHFFWPCWLYEVEAVLALKPGPKATVCGWNQPDIPTLPFTLGQSCYPLCSRQGSQPFWHQGSVSWKPIFLWMVVGEGRRNGFRMIQVYYIYCALYTYYYYTSSKVRSAGIKSQRLGTSAVEGSSAYSCKCSHEKS